ncbi:hypothetical protein AGDE_15036 [Angomonas deanei]|uniref:Uncharacterized protein n=1 Tax=Angomonas deanei TaxID=59799 RepID=A0A7G2CE48_9TRYP|nr:hypothetical protein AGDE_15036 [Angomonas deanei]CAD2217231.1 hypothetical protein, conserved [Angomonas deanei]|eukprot:EPY19791.1 hypothetical protein AGDE_15036 [Angomonas deanei]
MFNVLWEIVFGMSDDLAPPTEGIYRFERLVNLKVTLVNLFGMVVSLYGIFFFDLDGGVANAELTAANLKNLEKLMQSGQPPLQKRRGSSVPENGSEAEAPAKEETLLEKKKK